jgi:UDP-glucose 4-epimerase
MPEPEPYRDRRVLITGGLGFIGSNLAHRLVGMGAKLSVVDSLHPGCGGNTYNIEGICDRVEVHQGDIRDPDRMAELLRGIQVVFNLAGTLSHTESMADPFTDLDINCRGQIVLLEACRAVAPEAKLVFTGTRGQYGHAQRLPVDETHPLGAADANGINKTAGEAYHLLYHRHHGLRATSLRLSNTYGPRHQMKHPRQGVLGWFVRQVLEGKPIRVFGGGAQVRDASYVDDVVEALCLAGAREAADGEVFNLGGTPVSLLEFAQRLVALAGQGSWEAVPYPPGARGVEVGDFIADVSKARRVLGWWPTVGLDEGLQKTLDFYRREWSHYWP